MPKSLRAGGRRSWPQKPPEFVAAPARRGVRRRRRRDEATGWCDPRARRPTPSPSSTPKPSGCCASGWRCCGPASPSSARRRGGRGTTRRDGAGCSTRSTARSNFVYGIDGLRGVGGRAVRRRVGGRGGGQCARPERWAPPRSATAPQRRGAQSVDGTALQRPSTDLAMALVGTGFRLRRRASASRQAEVLAQVAALDVRDVRRIGSCALDLCMVAAGRLGRLLRRRRARLGLGRGGADRGGGRGEGAGCRPVDGGDWIVGAAAAPGIAGDSIRAGARRAR